MLLNKTHLTKIYFQTKNLHIYCLLAATHLTENLHWPLELQEFLNMYKENAEWYKRMCIPVIKRHLRWDNHFTLISGSLTLCSSLPLVLCNIRRTLSWSCILISSFGVNSGNLRITEVLRGRWSYSQTSKSLRLTFLEFVVFEHLESSVYKESDSVCHSSRKEYSMKVFCNPAYFGLVTFRFAARIGLLDNEHAVLLLFLFPVQFNIWSFTSLKPRLNLF